MEIAGQVLESKVSSLSEEMRRKVLQKIRSELENQILDRDETFVLSNPWKSTTIKKHVGSFGGTWTNLWNLLVGLLGQLNVHMSFDDIWWDVKKIPQLHPRIQIHICWWFRNPAWDV